MAVCVCVRVCVCVCAARMWSLCAHIRMLILILYTCRRVILSLAVQITMVNVSVCFLILISQIMFVLFSESHC